MLIAASSLSSQRWDMSQTGRTAVGSCKLAKTSTGPALRLEKLIKQVRPKNALGCATK